MSPKYYLISGIVVVILTMAISWWEQKKTVKEIFVYLGIAQDGFIIQREQFLIQREGLK